jgi:hypothetical protein
VTLSSAAKFLEEGGLGASQWASGARTGRGAGPRNSEGAWRKRSRGGRCKEEEGKEKTGAPTGRAEQSEEERGAWMLLGRAGKGEKWATRVGEKKEAAGWAAGLIWGFLFF